MWTVYLRTIFQAKIGDQLVIYSLGTATFWMHVFVTVWCMR